MSLEQNNEVVNVAWLFSDQMPHHHPVLNKGWCEWPVRVAIDIVEAMRWDATTILRATFAQVDLHWYFLGKALSVNKKVGHNF